MFVRDWLPFTRRYDSAQRLRAYRVTTVVYAILAALAAWVVATRTSISILDLLLFGFAMVVPPAIAVGYVIYWRRTTERGAYWGDGHRLRRGPRLVRLHQAGRRRGRRGAGGRVRPSTGWPSTA